MLLTNAGTVVVKSIHIVNMWRFHRFQHRTRFRNLCIASSYWMSWYFTSVTGHITQRDSVATCCLECSVSCILCCVHHACS